MADGLPAGLTRHKPNVFSLVMGLLFLGIGGLYLLSDLVHQSLDLRWTGPAVLIAVGVVGLVASIRHRDPADTD
jgi:hypothetical protein